MMMKTVKSAHKVSEILRITVSGIASVSLDMKIVIGFLFFFRHGVIFFPAKRSPHSQVQRCLYAYAAMHSLPPLKWRVHGLQAKDLTTMGPKIPSNSSLQANSSLLTRKINELLQPYLTNVWKIYTGNNVKV